MLFHSGDQESFGLEWDLLFINHLLVLFSLLRGSAASQFRARAPVLLCVYVYDLRQIFLCLGFLQMEAVIASIVMLGWSIYKNCLEENLAHGKHLIRLLAAAAIIITSGGNKVQKIGCSSSVPVSSPILHFHIIQEQNYINILSRNILGQ